MDASTSSSSSQIRRYHVFPSFHGSDVRRNFFSHLHYHFATKGITTFKDQEIERGHTIGPELVQAIRESRVSIVVLSKNYASSSWCLDELVEIFKCREDEGQIVMTIFYEVDPSSVRKQRGDFGSAFEKTCQGKTEEVKQRWSKALTDVTLFEFRCRENDDKIIECGVQILREEGESSNSSEVDCYEIGGNSNHHTDGDNEAEA